MRRVLTHLRTVVGESVRRLPLWPLSELRRAVAYARLLEYDLWEYMHELEELGKQFDELEWDYDRTIAQLDHAQSENMELGARLDWLERMYGELDRPEDWTSIDDARLATAARDNR